MNSPKISSLNAVFVWSFFVLKKTHCESRDFFQSAQNYENENRCITTFCFSLESNNSKIGGMSIDNKNC